MMSTAVSHKHTFFSPARILTIVGITFVEMVRLKVFYILLLFGFLLIGTSFFVGGLVQDQFYNLKDTSLGAMSIFGWLLGMLSTSMLIPKDLEDRTLYTILAKPVHRHEYLMGKLGGVMLMLLVATLAMTVMFLGTLFLRQHLELTKAYAENAPGSEALQDQLAFIRDSAWNWNLVPAITVIYVKSVVLATLTLLISTIASSWIFTIIVSTLVFFIGSLQSVAKEVWQSESGTTLSRLFLGLVALMFPDFQLFNLNDDAVAGVAISLSIFLKTVGIGGMYFVIYLLLAQFIFSTREI